MLTFISLYEAVYVAGVYSVLPSKKSKCLGLAKKNASLAVSQSPARIYHSPPLQMLAVTIRLNR